jgi:hypothetical protein
MVLSDKIYLKTMGKSLKDGSNVTKINVRKTLTVKERLFAGGRTSSSEHLEGSGSNPGEKMMTRTKIMAEKMERKTGKRFKK